MPLRQVELVSGSSLSPHQEKVLMPHFAWAQERIAEALPPTGPGWQSPEHPTGAWAHGLTYEIALPSTALLPHSLLHMSWIKSKAGIRFHTKEHECCIIRMGKRQHPILTCVTPTARVSSVVRAVLGRKTFDGLFSISVLRLHSGFFLLPEVREGGRTRLTLRVEFS